MTRVDMRFPALNLRTLVASLGFALAIVFGADVVAEDSVHIQPQTAQSTFFADQTFSFKLDLTADQTLAGKVTWQLSSLHRTLQRGEVAATLHPGKSNTVTFPLRLPSIKNGVSLKTTLSVSFVAAGDSDPIAKYERVCWIFAPDPFADQKQWLEELELQLFDPAGKTAKVFENAEIPFRRVRSAARLRTLKGGIVIVAEGTSPGSNSALAESLFALAASGRNVLWLAPDEGEFDFPGSETFAGKKPKNLQLSGSNIIRQLDPRLDANENIAQSVRLDIVARGNRTYVQIVAGNADQPDAGWSWLQAAFGDPDGQFILCGLRLVDRWDASPTSRFMLASLLEQLEPQRTIRPLN